MRLNKKVIYRYIHIICILHIPAREFVVLKWSSGDNTAYYAWFIIVRHIQISDMLVYTLYARKLHARELRVEARSKKLRSPRAYIILFNRQITRTHTSLYV